MAKIVALDYAVIITWRSLEIDEIGIEFINLPSIFKDKSVISSIPTYFENMESPIICYKYNKPIRSTVFNYNKLVTELDIENSIPDF